MGGFSPLPAVNRRKSLKQKVRYAIRRIRRLAASARAFWRGAAVKISAYRLASLCLAAAPLQLCGHKVCAAPIRTAHARCAHDNGRWRRTDR